MNVHPSSPLTRLLAQLRHDSRTAEGDPDLDRLRSAIGAALHVEVPIELLRDAASVGALAEALKHQVDHPGRLERLAERLLSNDRHAGAA